MTTIVLSEVANLEVTSRMVEFPSGSGTIRGFLAAPQKTGNYPGVIVIHEIWGLVPHIQEVSVRLAREGYVALAVDLFEGKTFTKLEDARKIREQLTEGRLMGPINAGYAYLKALENVNPKGIGSIGFCMGGGLSFLFACKNPELAAAVVFYGRNPSPIDLVKNLPCPVLCNYAGSDMGITEADISLLKETLTKYGKIFNIKVYPNAPHAFFNDTRESYRPEAAKDAWQRVLDFFGKHLKA